MALAELQRKSFGENRSHVTEAHGQLREKKTATFEHTIPCKLQENMLKPFDFPPEISMIFVMKITSFAIAKTTSFSKTLKTLARFSPRRDVYVCTQGGRQVGTSGTYVGRLAGSHVRIHTYGFESIKFGQWVPSLSIR